MLTNKNTPGSRFFRHFFACGAFYKGKSPYQCSIYLKIFACGAFCKCKFPYCDSIYLKNFRLRRLLQGQIPLLSLNIHFFRLQRFQSPYYHSTPQFFRTAGETFWVYRVTIMWFILAKCAGQIPLLYTFFACGASQASNSVLYSF